MSKDEMIKLLCGEFYRDFATSVAVEIVNENNFNDLFELHQNYRNYPKVIHDKIAFRSSYVIERIYFNYNDLFMAYVEQFFKVFPTITNGSMKRHYAKICADLLRKNNVAANENEIAKICLEWILDKKVKGAVKVWSLDILILLSDRVKWLRDVLPSVLDVISIDASPAICSRMKKWRKAYSYTG